MKTLTTATCLSGLIRASIFGALALSWGVASIASESDVPQVVVKFGDLKLSNPPDAAKLYGRITAASEELCKPYDVNTSNLGSRARVDACVHKVIADAVAKVNQPELFAIYHARNHQTRPSIVATAQTP